MDFEGALLVEERREDEPILIGAIRKNAEWATTDDIRKLLDVLVPRITRWFWMRPRVSKGPLVQLYGSSAGDSSLFNPGAWIRPRVSKGSPASAAIAYGSAAGSSSRDPGDGLRL
ncbi:hypothetical protein DPX16_0214 [Anabarilius grahami]|uniref:Uncharacterized protein n=1 Tax=Anabarilius grahami TaxID=495550 RepID=A0A3N0XGC8_ANAGA|nr:hypothetical protein DPX16_0214 [Anabarilius grahami]